MFFYSPLVQTYQPFTSPPQRYLAAAARQAEAEYIALQQEEAVLIRRLGALQLRKQERRLLHSRTPGGCNTGACEPLRHQVRDEEILRRHQAQEAVHSAKFFAPIPAQPEVTRCRSQSGNPIPSWKVPSTCDPHRSQCGKYTIVDPCPRLSPREKSSTQPNLETEVSLQNLFNDLFGHHGGSPHSKTPQYPEVDIQELLNNILAHDHVSLNENPPQQSATKPQDIAGVVRDVLAAFLKAFDRQSQATPSGEPGSSQPSPLAILKDSLQQSAFTPAIVSPSGAKTEQQANNSLPVSPNAPVAVESSLKAELEARLNDDDESEVRDTIHALIASLQDTTEFPSSITSSTSLPTGDRKGKEKANETSVQTRATATSFDVVKAMNQIYNIESAFVALESDFTFPSHLDFNQNTRTHSGSPASSGTETSAASRLSYTAQNHPVRFYEQALGSLIAQLDAVESFGDDNVRSKRRRVIERVELALGELEREVEGCWKARASQEDRPVEIAQPVTEVSESIVAAIKTSSYPASSTSLKSGSGSPANDAFGPISAVFDSAPATGTPISDTAHLKAEPTEVSLCSVETVTNPSSPSLLTVSEATMKGFWAEAPASDGVDTFLLSTPPDAEPAKRDTDGDTGSDWSEVEA